MVKIEHFDVVIVGGGIAGAATAVNIAKKSYRVLIIEEHRDVGRPVQCAGLVTPRIFEVFPDLSEKNCVLNKIRGAVVYSPSGKELKIDAKKTKALVVDRSKLDSNMMSLALHNGGALELGAKAISAKYNNNGIAVKIFKNEKTSVVNCKILIGADGVQSQVGQWFGLKGPKTIMSGFGAELTGVDSDPRFVEIYIGNSIAPNFFSWVIPKSNIETDHGLPARVGLVCNKAAETAFHYYHQLFKHQILGPKLANAKPIQYMAGGVPIGPVQKCFTNNLMLVGDSAGQVKPTSGGGIYTSLLCAKHCSDTAILALEKNDYSAKFLKSYQKSWLGELGKELKHGMRLHKIYMHLHDDQLEEGFKLLSEPEILDLISKRGDIDYPSKITKTLFKRVPQLLKFAKPYLRSFF
jgi:geranylgeranyl reductase family protein